MQSKFNMDAPFNSSNFFSFVFACMWRCHAVVLFCMRTPDHFPLLRYIGGLWANQMMVGGC